jgi:hypothetical protein
MQCLQVALEHALILGSPTCTQHTNIQRTTPLGTGTKVWRWRQDALELAHTRYTGNKLPSGARGAPFVFNYLGNKFGLIRRV